ncbi:MAG: hypothetical protein KDA65_12785 [Planctomycetaceae bacterium]|nr:hypothetical protein [Planctomycetaceae bacterium]
MNQFSFWKYLFSPQALLIHFLCLAVGGIFTYEFLSGKGDPEAVMAILFAVGAWPIMLGLSLWSFKHDHKMAVTEAKQRMREPEKLLRERELQRKISIFFLVGVALLAIYFGRQGWRIEPFPLQYLGYLFLLVASAGLVGINIWKSGPLDLNDDPVLPPVFDEYEELDP